MEVSDQERAAAHLAACRRLKDQLRKDPLAAGLAKSFSFHRAKVAAYATQFCSAAHRQDEAARALPA